MDTELFVAVLGFLGTVVGSLGGVLMSNKLTAYRIQQLEKKVDLHNSVIQRTFALEERVKIHENRIAEIEGKVWG